MASDTPPAKSGPEPKPPTDAQPTRMRYNMNLPVGKLPAAPK
jgi:hypothetical protein